MHRIVSSYTNSFTLNTISRTLVKQNPVIKKLYYVQNNFIQFFLLRSNRHRKENCFYLICNNICVYLLKFVNYKILSVLENCFPDKLYGYHLI